MSARLVLAAVGALAVATEAAHACTPAPGWPQLARFSPRSAAFTMAKAATYVDLVRVDDLTPDFDFALRTRDAWRVFVGMPPGDFQNVDQVLASYRSSWDGAVRIHYRVLKNLKAKSGSSFVISGERWPAPGKRVNRNARLNDLRYFLDQQDLAAWPGPGACESEVFAARGGSYLVFRDADGNLLRSPINVSFKGREVSIPGPAHVPVRGPDDPWVRLVQKTIPAH